MSRTYRDIKANREKRKLREWQKDVEGKDYYEIKAYNPLWNDYLETLKDNPKHYNFYKKNPGWFNRMYVHRPNRREETRLEKHVTSLYTWQIVSQDAVIWPLAKKPKAYFW